ncbi:MAG: hypothetical protein ACXWT3_08825 [Methylococcaceae bacterium]
MTLHAIRQKTAYLIRKPFDIVIIVLIAIVIIKLFSLYVSADIDDGSWNQFKTEHHCLLQTNESGTQRLSWVCDDGKTYYRWRQQR